MATSAPAENKHEPGVILDKAFLTAHLNKTTFRVDRSKLESIDEKLRLQDFATEIDLVSGTCRFHCSPADFFHQNSL
jgi:hypothetical protein